jgi:hypothetical protein
MEGRSITKSEFVGVRKSRFLDASSPRRRGCGGLGMTRGLINKEGVA